MFQITSSSSGRVWGVHVVRITAQNLGHTCILFLDRDLLMGDPWDRSGLWTKDYYCIHPMVLPPALGESRDSELCDRSAAAGT